MILPSLQNSHQDAGRNDKSEGADTGEPCPADKAADEFKKLHVSKRIVAARLQKKRASKYKRNGSSTGNFFASGAFGVAANLARDVPWTNKFLSNTYPLEKQLSELEFLKWRIEMSKLCDGERSPADVYTSPMCHHAAYALI
ncbi:hypothetical protein WJX75_007698 [Coccomyxa subellipsoidea]|uniref:Uncharacterized protein n=1 Tax=Coccomyxa subellipsoidea TaxID=248742 RepID=A0ABR2YW05_9CHLO